MTSRELASMAAVDESFVLHLVDLAILSPEAEGHPSGDIYRVRFAALAEASGISLDDLATSLAAGVVRMGDVDLLFPEPIQTSRTTHAELASELDVDPDLLRRIRLASGLTARRPEEPVQRDEEQILRLIVQLSRGFGDAETSIRIARNYGERVQRIVVSGMGAYEEFVYGPLMESMPTIDAETRQRTSQAGRLLIEKAEELLTTTHRRHMEAALLAMWVRTTESQMARHGVVETPPERPPAIAFVDLSGFTQLTEEEGDDVGIWLASQLVAETEATAAAHGSHIVKLLGDGVMLHSTDPGRLIDAAVELVETLPRAGLPPAHVGIHSGPLIERDGDYFGRTVNVAARIASQASPGEVLVSGAAVTRASPDLRLTELPTVRLRGVSAPMILFRVERS
jgi:adenylate cyclase